MVRQGDFEISLVHADTKLPFKEHTKDGKVYVEVEPNAEYFISMRRVGNSVKETLLASPSVDEMSLGYTKTFKPSKGEPYWAGLRSHHGNTSTQTALQFTKPRPAPEGETQRPSRSLMGKVQVEIHQGIFHKIKNGVSHISTSTWKESTLDQAQAGSLAKKKGLRSGPGSTTLHTQKSAQHSSYKKGSKVDVFTLHYCAAMGLIEVGVLPKPPLWVLHRMLHPAAKRSPSTATAAAAPMIRPTKIARSNNEENEMFDLSNLKNDDSDDDEE